MTTNSALNQKAAQQILWHIGELSWKLHAGQEMIVEGLKKLDRTARHVVILCGRRYGKTYMALLLAISRCLRQPGTRILVCAPTKTHIYELVELGFHAVTEDAPDGLFEPLKSTRRWKFHNESVLILTGLDTCAETVRGSKFDEIYLEECGSSNPNTFMYAINSVLLPTLLDPKDRFKQKSKATERKVARIFYISTLSKIVDHPFHTQIIPAAKSTRSFFSYPTTESPLYTQEDLAEMCRDVGGAESIDWLREFCNVLVRDASVVAVPEFNRTIVVPYVRPKWANFWIAGDFGGTRDRTHILLMSYDFARAKVQAVDEVHFEPGTGTNIVADGIRSLETRYELAKIPRYIDFPGQIQVDLMNTHGLAATLPNKDEFLASVNLVRSAIPTLEVNPSCEQLIANLEHGRLNKNRTDFERTFALGHCDGLMALCYGIRHANLSNPQPYHQGQSPITHTVDLDRRHEGSGLRGLLRNW